ncbi:MAG TPA: 3-deoxy-D-manno-octulosonic acid transferase [Acidocella sp.]|jgi:3-deoxy-D-manno-octulosonic-acid transferase|nr:3-deoxy-D-manno-octulosonic acid transferase [Acidocella sp.]
MISAYRLAGRLASPYLRRFLRQRAARGKEIPVRLPERYGVTQAPRPAGKLVWVHAASVGETMSVLPVIQALGGKAEVLLTTGTVTSAHLAAARLPAFARHQFVPLDVPGWGKRFLDHWRPDVAVFVESELWPGLLTECDRRNIPRLLINARISATSARNWGRVPRLTRRILAPFRHVHAQSAGDAENFRRLGLRDVLEWGNLKFFTPPLPVDEDGLAGFRKRIPASLWLAASTHPGEEELILQAHCALLPAFPDLVTVIVPRHPERGAEIAALAGNAPRRSSGEAPRAGQVYVADTLGELGLFFRAAPFAFIGNSLVGYGGHNLIEPAQLGRPVITGPHNENFLQAAARLRAAQALIEVTDCASLTAAVRSWLREPDAAEAAGGRAAAALRTAEDLPLRLADLILKEAE